MIFNQFVNFISFLYNSIFSFFPVVTLADIPVIGSSAVSILEFCATTWNAVFDTFPYAHLPWLIFLAVIIPFETLMLVAKVLLGSRVPKND